MDPDKLRSVCDEITISKLKRLKLFLFELMETFKMDFLQLNLFNSIIDEMREIFDDEDVKKRIILKKFKKMSEKVSRWSNDPTISEKYRAGYVHLLNTIKKWQKKLFVYKNHPKIPRTNNSIEHLFGEKKSWMRRTSGVKFGNKSFSLYGEYITFVDTNWSLDQIKDFLQVVDYHQAFPRIQQEKQKSRERRLQNDKLKHWEEDFKERSRELILSLHL